MFVFGENNVAGRGADSSGAEDDLVLGLGARAEPRAGQAVRTFPAAAHTLVPPPTGRPCG